MSMTSSLVAENFGLGVVFKPPDQFQQVQNPYEMRVICIPVQSDLYDYDPSAPTEAEGWPSFFKEASCRRFSDMASGIGFYSQLP